MLFGTGEILILSGDGVGKEGVLYTQIRLDLCLRLICRAYLPGIEEYQFQVHASTEHEHVLMQLNLCNRGWGQRMTNGHQAQVLHAVVGLSVGIFHLEHARLQIPGTVYDLE